MAFIIKSQLSNIFWTGKPDSVWSDQISAAERYDTIEDAEIQLEEKASQYGYIVHAVDEDDVVIEEPAPTEEPTAEEPTAE